MLIFNVDDDEDDREMFQAAVHAVDPSLICLPFESGSKAIAYLLSTEVPPDFLFIDINMPKMDGYECLEQLRKISGNGLMRIVMYSTAFNPKQQEAFKDWNIRYLKKTSKFSDLVHSMDRIFTESKELAGKSKR
jgi:CheY-like chemotaxis protein